MTIGLLITLLWAALANTGQTTAGWRGIIPLKSTCDDVKRVLKVEKCDLPVSEYTFTDTRVVVYFSTCRCCEGWRVKRRTVTSIAVYPLKRQHVSELSLDSGYEKIEDEEITGGVEFVSRTKGVTVYALNGSVIEILYYPTSTQTKKLRCPTRKNRAFDFYSDIPLDDEEARLDNFAFQLQQDQNATSYIVVYAGRLVDTDEAKKRAERARNYLVNKRNIKAERIIVTYGGYREEFTVELYFVPRGAPAPVTIPTGEPSEAQIIKNGTRSNNTRSQPPRKQCRPPTKPF